MTSLIHAKPQRTLVRAYNSMWIADCVCANAEALERFQPAVECSYCGLLLELEWPAEKMVYSIERVLLMRPWPHTRNWFPGETVHDLIWENGQHGILSDPRISEGHSPGANLLVVDDEGIRIDMLPITRQREFKAIG